MSREGHGVEIFFVYRCEKVGNTSLIPPNEIITAIKKSPHQHATEKFREQLSGLRGIWVHYLTHNTNSQNR